MAHESTSNERALDAGVELRRLAEDPDTEDADFFAALSHPDVDHRSFVAIGDTGEEMTLLTSVIMTRDAPIWLRSVVARGADINERASGLTPLMWAVNGHRTASVHVLLELGADRTLTSLHEEDYGQTAAEMADDETSALIRGWTNQPAGASTADLPVSYRVTSAVDHPKALAAAVTVPELTAAIAAAEAPTALCSSLVIRKAKERLQEMESDMAAVERWSDKLRDAQTATQLVQELCNMIKKVRAAAQKEQLMFS